MGTFHSNDLVLSSKHPLYYDVTDRRSKQVDYYVVIDNQRAKTVGHFLLGAQWLLQQHSLQVADTMPGRYDQQQYPIYVAKPSPVQNPPNHQPPYQQVGQTPHNPTQHPEKRSTVSAYPWTLDDHSLDRRKMINWQPQYQVPQNEVFEESAQQQMMGLPNGHVAMSRPTRYHPFLHAIHEEQEPASHGIYEGPKDDSKQTLT
ncbi:uncharacterized protein LOC143448695 [Clavelina lepadiformis]|uniref:uncharacterized protein LOC143448695 n=1 Tax=Clavelina lepadiformis TaxID=159417 RepID=UPI0040414425